MKPFDARLFSTFGGVDLIRILVVKTRSWVLLATVFLTVVALPGTSAAMSRLPHPALGSGNSAAIFQSAVPTSTSCPLTPPSRNVPPAVARMNRGTVLTTSQSGWFGNGRLWVELPAHSVLFARRLPHSGQLQVKFAWFRAVRGQVRVKAHMREGATARFNAEIGTVAEYGPTGFVPSVLSFARSGCWVLTGGLGRNSLTFVLRVAIRTSSQ